MKSTSLVLLLGLLVVWSCDTSETEDDSQTTSDRVETAANDLKITAEQTAETIESYVNSIKRQGAYDCSDDLTDLFFAFAKEAENFAIDFFPLSEAEEETIGDEMHAELSSELTLINADPRRQKLRNILFKLIPNRNRGSIEYDIHLAQDEQVNAFAIAGGHIYVTTGLLKFVQSDDELASIIGHEIAHVDDKHCVRKIQRIVKAQELLGEPGAIAANVGLLITAPFGQVDEYEADKRGAWFAQQGGYNPRKGLDFFSRLKEQENDYSLMEKLFRTHPFSEQRETCLDDYISNDLGRPQ